MRIRFGGLWRHPDFVRLWSGQTISVFGSLIGQTALPFTAIIYLKARPLEVALITSSSVLAGICVGLFAGVWVDRLRRRPIMIAADLGRAAVLATVPLAAAFGVLRIEQLYAVAFVSGVLTTFFDVAYASYLPTLVRPDELVEGNSKLTGSAAVAEFGGFSAAGWLVQLLTGPGAVLIDAVSFVWSALAVRSIRTPETAPVPPAGRLGVLPEIGEGLRFVAREPVLRAVTASFVALQLAFGMVGAVFLLYTNRELGFSPGVLGMIFGVGGVMSFVGALVAGWAGRRFGVGGSMILGLAIAACGLLVVAGAREASLFAAVLLVGQQLISDGAWTVYEINQMSLRQALAPERLLGRVNAAIRFAGLVAMLIGSLTAGAAADAAGPRVVIVAAACVMLAGAASLLLSPARRVRELGAAASAVIP